MAVFPILELEAKVQTGEKTRLNGTKSFLTQDEAAVTLVRIRPSASDSFITVSAVDATDSSYWFLDWQYSTTGTKTIDLEITAGAVTTYSATIVVTDSSTERLFSSDQDIMSEEPDILRFVRDGKSSFNDLHRTAQTKVMDEIYRAKIFDVNGAKLTVADVIEIDELKPWSKYMVLKMIFESVSNAVDDVFALKSAKYAKAELEARNMAFNQMRLDYNKDENLEVDEHQNFRSGDLVRV